jgi:hypothetical protein
LVVCTDRPTTPKGFDNEIAIKESWLSRPSFGRHRSAASDIVWIINETGGGSVGRTQRFREPDQTVCRQRLSFNRLL